MCSSTRGGRSPLYMRCDGVFRLSIQYRNIVFIVSPLPCSRPFYTTIAFKSYIPQRIFFYHVLFKTNKLHMYSN